MESNSSNPPTSSGLAAGRSLDDTDRTLLLELQRDGRLPIAELAERAHISRSAAYSRLERLRVSGVIQGFGVRVDPHAVGLLVTALIFLSVNQDHWQTVQDDLIEVPEVEFLGLAAGDFDCVAIVRTTDTDALRDVVLRRLRAIPDVRSTKTVILLDNVSRAPHIP